MRVKRIMHASAGVCALGCLFAFYMLWRPLGIHVSDSYAWVNTVETESFAYFFHPHHVLYIPLAWRWSRLAGLFAPGVSTWAAMAGLSAAFGCIGVAAVHRILRELGAPRAAAAAGAGLQATLFGYWFFSSEPEVYVVSAACALWSLFFLLRLYNGGSLNHAAWAGAAAGLAALFHQTGIFLFAPAAVIIVLGRRAIARRGAAFTAAFGLVVTPVYLAACRAAVGTVSPAAFLRWIFLFGGEGYGGFQAGSPARAGLGFSRAIIGGQALLDHLRGAPVGATIVLLGTLAGLAGAAALAALACVAVKRFRTGRAPVRATAAACLTAFGTYGLFSVYFDPANFEWWVIPQAFLCLAITGVVLAAERPRTGLVWAAVVLVAAANFLLDFSHRRRGGTDIVRSAAREVARMTTPQDVIVVPCFLGSVLWYENRDRVIFCPDKAARRLGEDAAAAAFASLVDRAASQGACVVTAGTDLDEHAAELLEHVRAAGGKGRQVGEIVFFGRAGRIVRRLEPVPVMAFDAARLREGTKAARVAAARGVRR